MVGEKVRRLRLRAGMSQKELADKLDRAKSTISRWENNGPPESAITKLSHALGVSRSALTGETEKEESEESQYANSRASVTDWMSSVLSSGHTPDEKLVLAAIAAFYDDDIRAVPISKAELIEETSIGENRVNSVWETIVASEFLERRGRSRWTFKLRFPTPDSETIDA